MSRRREYARRLEALSEIAGIMSAMKALSTMEIRRLRDYLACQQRMVASIERCAAEFIVWHSGFADFDTDGSDLCVLVGSEQGFCGDYNESVRNWLRNPPADCELPHHRIVLGQRLAARLDGAEAPVAVLPGASVADELPAVLQSLSTLLREWLEAKAGAGLSILYHCDANGCLRLRHLLPLRDLPVPPVPIPFASELNLPPADFFSTLSTHYLYAVLNEVLYSALMAENRQRLAHMESALHKLEEDQERLRLAHNAQRQEEITEEIEIIQLSVGMLAEES